MGPAAAPMNLQGCRGAGCAAPPAGAAAPPTASPAAQLRAKRQLEVTPDSLPQLYGGDWKAVDGVFGELCPDRGHADDEAG